MEKDKAERPLLVLWMWALEENLWSLHHMDPPGQRMFNPNARILVQTHPSIQHPARYVEAWTIRQTTVREADERKLKDPSSPSSWEDEASRRRCPNCMNEHPGECPCGWCNQPGHILSQRTARHDSEVMRQRFPKRIKRKKPTIGRYQCWKCSQYHSFQEYCLNIPYP